MDYRIAIMFELACNVRRSLEAAGRKPTIEDDRYINELQCKLSKSKNGFIEELVRRYPHI